MNKKLLHAQDEKYNWQIQKFMNHEHYKMNKKIEQISQIEVMNKINKWISMNKDSKEKMHKMN